MKFIFVLLTVTCIKTSSISPKTRNDGALKITNFQFTYTCPNDVCRKPLLIFSTAAWNSTSTFTLVFIAQYDFFEDTIDFGDVCLLERTKKPFGICKVPNAKLIHGMKGYFRLTQKLKNTTVLTSNKYPLKIDYIGQNKTGNLLNFQATPSVTDSSIQLSWIQQWPLDLTNCSGLSNLKENGFLMYLGEECSNLGKGTCKDLNIQTRETKCTSVSNKRWQSCSFNRTGLAAGAKYSYRLRYTFGLGQLSSFTGVVNVSTLPEIPTRPFEVNCSISNGYPYFEWEEPKEKLLKPYQQYRIRWTDGNYSFEHYIPFGKVLRYKLTSVQLTMTPTMVFYMGVCTAKGCFEKKQSCRIRSQANNHNGNAAESSKATIRILVPVVIAIVAFFGLILIITFSLQLYQRRVLGRNAELTSMRSGSADSIQIVTPRAHQVGSYEYPSHVFVS